MQKIDTKEKIIQAAESLFFQKGYNKVSVQLIITEVGIAKGTFYHHFLSKAELLDEIINRKVDEIIKGLEIIANDKTLTPVDKLNTIFKTSAQWKIDQMPLMVSIMEAWLSEDNTVIRAKMEAIGKKKSIPFFQKIISEGVERGGFNTAKMRPQDVAGFFTTLSLSLMDDLSHLLLGFPENPEYGEELMHISKSYAVAVERLLGIPENTLNFMIKDFLQEIVEYTKTRGAV